MKFNFFDKAFLKKKFRTLKAYKIILKNNKIERIDKIKEKLIDTKIVCNNEKINSFFFGDLKINLDLSLRQFVYSRLIYYKINECLCRSLAFDDKIIFPLPLPWIRVLEKENLNVSIIGCSLLWFLFIAKFFLIAQFFSLKTIFNFFFKKKFHKKNSIYFFDFPYGNLQNKTKFINLIKIFKKKFGHESTNIFYHDDSKLPDFLKLSDNLSLIKNKNFIRISSLGNFLLFILLWPFYSFLTLVLIFYNYSYLILLKELLLSKIFTLENTNQSSVYFFSNSSSLYRPLWTYFIELSGSKYYYYFYSLSCPPIKEVNFLNKEEFNKYFRSNYFGLKYISWDKFLFTTKFQMEFYVDTLVNKKISYQIDNLFFDTGRNCKINTSKKILGVFDVSPFRFSYCAYRNAPLMTQHKQTQNFYTDIIALKNKFDLHLIFKIKRADKSLIISKNYINYLKNLQNEKNVTVLAEDYSVESVIDRCDAIISFPFTTAGFIGKLLNKNSAFYDLSPCKYRLPLAYNKVLIIKDFDALNNWIAKI